MYQISPQGLASTKRFEGVRLSAYQDSVGVWTIGYGHTGPDVYPGLTITEQQAETLLLADMQEAVDCVNGAVNVSLTQGQFDACADFCFNCGCHAFLNSTLLRKLNLGDYAGAASQFVLWDHAGGQVLPGLLTRRKAEAAMFKGANQWN